MAITNPHIISGPIVSATGSLTAASQVERTDTTDVETALTNLDTMIAQVGGGSFSWNYNSETDGSPPNETFEFNNTNPASATIIYFDKDSLTGRLDQFLEQFAIGGFIFLQDRTNTGNSYLFVTTSTFSDAGDSARYTVSVTFQQGKGTFTGANGDTFDVIFIPITGSGSGGQLPNMFLNEIQEVDTNAFTNRVDVPGDAAFVRFWLRTDLVTPTNVNDVGVGLRIDEANGPLNDNGPTFQQNTNNNNVYVYVTLPDVFVGAQNLNNIYLVVKDAVDGNIVDTYQFGTSFILQTDIDGSVAGTPYRSNTGLNGGTFLHYQANQTLELFFVTVNQFFDIPEANADNVDLTRAIKNLTEDQTDGDFQAKLNYTHGIPDDDQFKLDQLVEVSTTSTPAQITGSDTVYYKLGSFSNEATDYFTTDFDTGLPPSFDQSTTWIVVAPHNHNITSLVGLESGTGTATLVKDDVLLNGATGTFNVYRAVVPVTVSGTNFFVFFGTVTTITEIDPSDLFKIDRDNVQPDFLTHIENSNATDSESQRLTALENKVSVLYPLAPDIDALTNWGDIYTPERANQEVVLTSGYDLFADYRGASTRYESAGVTYSDAGTNVVTYTGLSESLNRVFGFKVNGPANQVLMWLIDGSTRIPFVDMTAAGNYRINNYTQSATASTPTTETTILTGTNTTISVGGSSAQFVIPSYPAGATETSRALSLNFEVLVNGVDTGAGHFESIDIPETDIAQGRIERTATANLGPLHGGRTVTFTYDYRLVVTTVPDYQIRISLQNAPSDVTLRVDNMALVRTYTPAANIIRTDNFNALGDGGGTYTFTGENELVISLAPYPGNNIMNVVPVAVDSVGTIDQLNDAPTPVPVDGFASVEIPDQTALAGFEFRTFRGDHHLNHSDLATLLADRLVQWAYGLARLRTVSTTHAVSEIIDLATGSTVGGSVIDSGRTNQDAQTFTAAASVTITLPVGTTLSTFIIMEVTWHTGVGTATDNNNRNYSEIGYIPAIINATDSELILGGRGRGADNYGIEVTTTGLSGASTSLTLDIINLNDTGGAVLPAGSLITSVRFY